MHYYFLFFLTYGTVQAAVNTANNAIIIYTYILTASPVLTPLVLSESDEGVVVLPVSSLESSVALFSSSRILFTDSSSFVKPLISVSYTHLDVYKRQM